MKNPFGDQKIPGSYHNLPERLYKKVKAAKVEEQILTIMTKAFEDALNEENVIFGRPERNRLFGEIAQLIFNDINNRLDKKSGTT